MRSIFLLVFLTWACGSEAFTNFDPPPDEPDATGGQAGTGGASGTGGAAAGTTVESDAGQELAPGDAAPDAQQDAGPTCGCQHQAHVPAIAPCGPTGAPSCDSVGLVVCYRCTDPCVAKNYIFPDSTAMCSQVVSASGPGAFTFWCCPWEG